MGPPFPPPLGSSLVFVFLVMLVSWGTVDSWNSHGPGEQSKMAASFSLIGLEILAPKLNPAL